MDSKDILASNLKKYMDLNEKSRKDVSEAIGVSYYTFTDWVNGKKFPRMDKVEKLAAYFGIQISDLIEEKSEEHQKMQEKNNTLADVIIRMRTDAEFLSLVETLYKLDRDKIHGVQQMLHAFLK